MRDELLSLILDLGNGNEIGYATVAQFLVGVSINYVKNFVQFLKYPLSKQEK